MIKETKQITGKAAFVLAVPVVVEPAGAAGAAAVDYYYS